MAPEPVARLPGPASGQPTRVARSAPLPRGGGRHIQAGGRWAPRPWLRLALLVLAIAVGPAPTHAQDVIHGPAIPLDQSAVQLAVDSRQPLGQVGDPDAGPSYRLRGWAVDLRAPRGPGIRQMLAYLDGPSERGHLLGWARYGRPRPDVATVFNDPALTSCGFELTWAVADVPLQIEPVHSYTLFLYIESTSGWVLARVPVALSLAADSNSDE